MITAERTETHIVLTDGEYAYRIALDSPIQNTFGHEAGTLREALDHEEPIYIVDDDARGESSYGMHGAVYVGGLGHENDYRVL